MYRSRKLRLALAAIAAGLMTVGIAACGTSPTATPTATSSGANPTATPTAMMEPDTPTPSFDAEAYFKGQTITIIVPYGAGGGTDLIARALAAQWGKFIPGHPNIQVQNKEPQIAGLNEAWHAKPDGFTVGTMSASGWYQQKYLDGSDFSANGWNVLGAVSKSDFAVLARKDVPYTSLDQAEGGDYALVHGLAAVDPGQLSGRDVQLFWLADQLDIPYQVVGITKFNSSSTALVAFERGDVNILTRNGGGGWGGLAVTRPGWETGPDPMVHQLVSMTNPNTKPGDSEEGGPWTAKNVVDFLSPDQKNTWLGIMPYPSFDKPYMLPPDTPDDIVKAMQDSFWAMFQDPDASSTIQKALGSIPYEPSNGAEDTKETRDTQPLYDANYPKIATDAQLQSWLDKYSK